MAPQTLNATAGRAMRPVSHRLTPDDTARAALDLMREQDLDFVPVVDSGNGELLGIVLRKALENGCDRMGHDLRSCPIRNHLKMGVLSCHESDPVVPGHTGNGTPLMVLDANRSPVGYLTADV